jgi:hypothetical protein
MEHTRLAKPAVKSTRTAARRACLSPATFLPFPHGSAHAIHDGSDAAGGPGSLRLRISPPSRSWEPAPGCYCYEPSESRAGAWDVAREGDQATAREI